MSPLRRARRLPKTLLSPFRSLARGLAAGGRETAARLRPAVSLALRTVGRPLGAGARAITLAARRVTARLGSSIGGVVRAAEDLASGGLQRVRPEFVLALAAGLAGAALVAAQFLDYKSVEVLTVERGGRAAGSAHAYLLIPVGILAMVAARATASRPNWRLGRALILLGAITLAVTLAVDLPKAVDTGELAREYADASAHVASGFWVELLSGLTLVISGILLIGHERRPERTGTTDEGPAISPESV